MNVSALCTLYWGGVSVCPVCASYLVSIHHEVVSGDEGFEDHHPAGVGRALEQRVRQLGDVHVHLVGAVDEIWHWERGGRGKKMNRTTKQGEKRQTEPVINLHLLQPPLETSQRRFGCHSSPEPGEKFSAAARKPSS